MLQYKIPESYSTIKISDYLRQLGISLTLRRKIKHRGQVLLNGQPVILATLASAGDILQIDLPAQPKLTPTQLPLNIAYEDADLLVVNKPPGMLVHPSAKLEDTTLANAVPYCREMSPNLMCSTS
jgi:23S rRNA pseudouridine1911/1915/1917 synthase